MLIEIRVGRNSARRFHLDLADRLRRRFAGCEVWLRIGDGEPSWPGTVEALLSLERLLLRRPRQAPSDVLLPSDIGPAAPPATKFDVVIDCSGLEQPDAEDRSSLHLRPLYGGLASTQALVAALLAGSLPDITIEDMRSGKVVASGKPGGGSAGLIGGFEAVVSRMSILVESAIRTPDPIERRAPRHDPNPTAQRVLSFALHNLVMDCTRAIFHLCFDSPHWRIGWRLHDGPGVIDRGDLLGPPWQVLPDSGRSFYADPFPVYWKGRTFVFFEELEHRINKGFISAIEFGPDGPIGNAIPILEEPWHLSYPFIMEHQGELYMVPESSLSNSVPLYRCTEFPLKWERVGTLLDGIEAADCTIFRHDGLFWMTSATREGVGGYSDTLAIHYADDLLGHWTEHAQRPALLDIGAARPAGKVVEKNGRLWRPVQDCSSGYGKVLGLAEVERLDRVNFSQALRARIEPGAVWPGRRVHTVNREGRLECIDGAIHNPRLPFARDLMAARMAPKTLEEQ